MISRKAGLISFFQVLFLAFGATAVLGQYVLQELTVLAFTDREPYFEHRIPATCLFPCESPSESSFLLFDGDLESAPDSIALPDDYLISSLQTNSQDLVDCGICFPLNFIAQPLPVLLKGKGHRVIQAAGIPGFGDPDAGKGIIFQIKVLEMTSTSPKVHKRLSCQSFINQDCRCIFL
jgi:hypothetical protein